MRYKLSRDLQREINHLKELKQKHGIYTTPDTPMTDIDLALEALNRAFITAIIEETVND